MQGLSLGLAFLLAGCMGDQWERPTVADDVDISRATPEEERPGEWIAGEVGEVIGELRNAEIAIAGEDVLAAQALVSDVQHDLESIIARMPGPDVIQQDERPLYPLEDARAHVVEARAALEHNNEARALAELDAAEPLLGRVVATAPLVPARWSMLAAADSLEAGDRIEATRQLRRAELELKSVHLTANSPLVPLAEKLEGEVQAMVGRLPVGTVLPEQIRQLALRTLTLPAAPAGP